MITVEAEAIAPVKEEMKECRSILLGEVRQLEEEYKERAMPEHVRHSIVERNQKVDILKVTVTVPARLKDGLVINYKLYESFRRKLRDFSIIHEVKSDRLLLYYQKDGTKGELTLFDLSGVLNDLNNIPHAELVE